MIIKSACRGDGRNTSEPKRATSKRDAAIDIISIAQHAKPNPKGQMELLRAQFTALSSCVKMIPSSCSSLPKSSGFSSVTFFPMDMLIRHQSPQPFSHSLALGARRTRSDACLNGSCRRLALLEQELRRQLNATRSPAPE